MSLNEHLTRIFSSTHDSPGEIHYKDIAKEYPYCSLAQFYFLQHLKKNNFHGFEKQAQTTALYFSNINWLNWQLHNCLKPENSSADITIISSNISIIEEPKNVAEPADSILAIQKQDALKLSFQKNNNDKEIIAFEPLHTVDYFASQGIKITDEPITNDKLGNQMKSFTEWLKSMKRIHVHQTSLENEQNDNKIQSIAEGSNVQTDVITEAMAEVLIKQNKLEKAIDMYNKLSLQNPSKRAYFADRIKSLKSV